MRRLNSSSHLQALTFSVGLGAPFNESNGILHKLPTWLNELHYLIHDACLKK